MPANLTPVQFCENLTASYIETSSPKIRKDHGQFFTPMAVAEFMASLAEYQTKKIRVLDAGAGIGILSCAVCEAASKNNTVKKIEIDAYENHPSLLVCLNDALEFARRWLIKYNVDLSYNIIGKDFILSNTQRLLKKEFIPYDLAIGNPPYFKIAKDDPRAIDTSRFVYGQPNIYSLFMGVSAELLRKNGIMVYITPRSYASGSYFKVFRYNFFKIMNPVRIHLFKSRKDAFRRYEVLQENIILKVRKLGKNKTVRLTVSNSSSDLNDSLSYRLRISKVLHLTNRDIVLRLPMGDEDNKIIDIVEAWSGNLHNYGLEISTGPVVPFRAKNLLVNRGHNNTAPLLWMQNIHPMYVQWPYSNMKNGKGKSQFIIINKESLDRRLLVKSQNVVLLRRFSAKEDRRRLTAAPLLKSELVSNLIGLENHVNYIYSPIGLFGKIKALGLSALLNSSLLDKYFRISNGNTQVSATEIRAMPLPPIDIIEEIGIVINSKKHIITHKEIDDIVMDKILPNLDRGKLSV